MMNKKKSLGPTANQIHENFHANDDGRVTELGAGGGDYDDNDDGMFPRVTTLIED